MNQYFYAILLVSIAFSQNRFVDWKIEPVDWNTHPFWIDSTVHYSDISNYITDKSNKFIKIRRDSGYPFSQILISEIELHKDTLTILMSISDGPFVRLSDVEFLGMHTPSWKKISKFRSGEVFCQVRWDLLEKTIQNESDFEVNSLLLTTDGERWAIQIPMRRSQKNKIFASFGLSNNKKEMPISISGEFPFWAGRAVHFFFLLKKHNAEREKMELFLQRPAILSRRTGLELYFNQTRHHRDFLQREWFAGISFRLHKQWSSGLRFGSTEFILSEFVEKSLLTGFQIQGKSYFRNGLKGQLEVEWDQFWISVVAPWSKFSILNMDFEHRILHFICFVMQLFRLNRKVGCFVGRLVLAYTYTRKLERRELILHYRMEVP